MGTPCVVFAPEDVWQAAADGGIAFVRSEGYRVDWLDPALGRRINGAATPYRSLAVTSGDRTDYVASFMVTSSMSARGSGGVTAAPLSMRTPAAIALR